MMSAIRAAEVNSTSPAGDAALVAKCTYRISRFWFEIPTVHHVDESCGRISFDVDPDATGLVLREASGFWQVVPCRQNPGECRVVFRACLSVFMIKFKQVQTMLAVQDRDSPHDKTAVLCDLAQ
ncbi:unnamed protein product [Symbiodinium pilosum]|uniref:Uncharacterized protein n=1 Tax=Symbiodinium pilosum TaxID=2952 RepID=A0A812XSQ6_SYMPI|nr:unnamed protein product [Symbiodinium pilosum]